MNRTLVTGAGTAVLLLAGGCGSPPAPNAVPPPVKTTARPTDSYRWPAAPAPIDAGLRDDLVRTVRRHQNAFDVLLSDPGSTEFVAAATKTATAAELRFVRTTATSMTRDGLVGHGHFRARWVVLTATRQQATVAGCGRPDQVQIYHRRSGRPAENPNPGVAVLTYSLRAEKGGRWLVSEVTPKTADRCPEILETPAG